MADEKVVGWFSAHDSHAAPTTAVGEDAEKQMTSGAIRTDFILSAEIMVIALNEVADESFVFWSKGDTAFVEEGPKQTQTYSGCFGKNTR